MMEVAAVNSDKPLPASSDVGEHIKKLRNSDLYFSRPDFRSVVDQLANIPGLSEVMASLNGALTISEMSRDRHTETETLYEESELSTGGTNDWESHIHHRERSLRSQINEVQKRIRRHREEHIAIVGSAGTIADLNQRQKSLIGQLRALEFVIDHNRARRCEIVGDSISVELDEARCMKRYACAKQANELLRQQISAVEADVARLVSIRNRPYPSTSDTQDIQVECSELDVQIHALEMEITLLMGSKDSEKSIKTEAESVLRDLIAQLTLVESHYAQLCDSTMDSLSSLMELHEKKLKLYQLQREYLDEFGDTEGDNISIDFESGDIETDKSRLKKLHKELKFYDEFRNACANRIDELNRILTSIHV